MITVFFLVLAGVASSEKPPHGGRSLEEAIKLKQEKVLYTLEQCRNAFSLDTGFCEHQISIIGEKDREDGLELLKMFDLKPVDRRQFNKQLDHCYEYPDYNSFVLCKGGLVERLKDGLSGRDLVR